LKKYTVARVCNHAKDCDYKLKSFRIIKLTLLVQAFAASKLRADELSNIIMSFKSFGHFQVIMSVSIVTEVGDIKGVIKKIH